MIKVNGKFKSIFHTRIFRHKILLFCGEVRMFRPELLMGQPEDNRIESHSLLSQL